MKKYDVIITGAGASGLFAAVRLAGAGRTAVLEKMDSPGKKLLLSGSGRCNFTNQCDLETFLNSYGNNGRFLRSAFSRFSNADLMSFIKQAGISTVCEGQKVFAAGGSAAVLNIFLNQSRNKADFLYRHQVREVLKVTDGFFIRTDEQEFFCRKLIIAAGGRSYPGTGSSGDGYKIAENLGHTISRLTPALCGLSTGSINCELLNGVSISDVLITSGQKRHKKESSGGFLFNSSGISGPAVMNLSRYIGGNEVIRVNFLPDKKQEVILNILKKAFHENPVRAVKNNFYSLGIPERLSVEIWKTTGESPDRRSAEISEKTCRDFCSKTSEFPFSVSPRGFEQAMATAGGVSLKEINPVTMESKLVEGLYFIGEVLDIDGDCGGFNLQAAFSTAWCAAADIREKLAK